ncbi:helix-turn-helix domain-containing protein [Labrys sp. 22185]|uniref:helix-turn-helix domain-containing protein n=1 Tax=Labrys sp. 22185 TaxID=3453888 RepID=UPI003F874BB2
MESTTTIGERLAIVRKRHRLAMGAIASILGLPRGAYARIEDGRQELTAPAMTRLVEHLGVDPLWLLTGQGDPECDPEFMHTRTVDRVVGLEGRVSALEALGAKVSQALEQLRSMRVDPAASKGPRPTLNKTGLVDLTGHQRRRIKQAHERGATVGQIALQYQVSRATVLMVLDKPLHRAKSAAE